jgi:hypothetical protein
MAEETAAVPETGQKQPERAAETRKFAKIFTFQTPENKGETRATATAAENSCCLYSAVRV